MCRVSNAEIAVMGKWNSTHVDMLYLNKIEGYHVPFLVAAGHTASASSYILPRSRVIPPRSLTDLVLPRVLAALHMAEENNNKKGQRWGPSWQEFPRLIQLDENRLPSKYGSRRPHPPGVWSLQKIRGVSACRLGHLCSHGPRDSRFSLCKMINLGSYIEAMIVSAHLLR